MKCAMDNKKEKCPLCGRTDDLENNPYKPFCSERCKIIDLGQWASEKYRIPGKHSTAEEEKSEKIKKTKE